MGCNASKDVIKSAKVTPATYEEYEKAQNKEVYAGDSAERIVASSNSNEAVDDSIQEELDKVKRSTGK